MRGGQGGATPRFLVRLERASDREVDDGDSPLVSRLLRSTTFPAPTPVRVVRGRLDLNLEPRPLVLALALLFFPAPDLFDNPGIEHWLTAFPLPTCLLRIQHA